MTTQNMPTTAPRNVLGATCTRDLFAMHALAGLLAAHSGEVAMPTPEEAAKMAREYAEALVFELNNEPFPG